MSTNFYVYVGPALICQPANDIVKKTTKTCLNAGDVFNNEPACRNHGKRLDSKHCPECGSAIGDMTKDTVGRKFSPYEFTDAIKEKLSHVHDEAERTGQEEDVYVPNIGKLGIRMGDGGGEGGMHELTPVEVATGLNQFASEFSKELSKAEEMYGKDNVRVRHVVLGYWS